MFLRNPKDFSEKSWFDGTLSWGSPTGPPVGSPRKSKAQCRLAGSGSPRAGLAGFGFWLRLAVAWLWLALGFGFRLARISAGFGLILGLGWLWLRISVAFGFWLSYTKILLGFDLIWLEFGWI